MRRCLKGLGGFPTSTDGFILGPSHGTVGRLDYFPQVSASRKSFSALHFCCAFLILIPGRSPGAISRKANDDAPQSFKPRATAAGLRHADVGGVLSRYPRIRDRNAIATGRAFPL